MSYEHILFDLQDGVATVTLNRPDKLNAYIVEMGEEVVDAFQRISEDDDARVAILTGAGKGFCAGVDLEHLKQSQANQSGAGAKGPKLGEEDFVRKFPLELASFPKPVIAAINGAAIGVGVTMVLPCDIRIAAEGAKLGVTFTKLGILPGLGSTHLLPKIVGMANAQELVLTARVILAPEAKEMGLVNKVVPAEQLQSAALEMAKRIASAKPVVIQRAKEGIQFGAAHSMEEAMIHERENSAALRKARS